MERLKQRADFLAAARGAKAPAAAFVLQARKRDDEGPVRVRLHGDQEGRQRGRAQPGAPATAGDRAAGGTRRDTRRPRLRAGRPARGAGHAVCPDAGRIRRRVAARACGAAGAPVIPDDRQQEHHSRHRAVGDCADWRGNIFIGMPQLKKQKQQASCSSSKAAGAAAAGARRRPARPSSPAQPAQPGATAPPAQVPGAAAPAATARDARGSDQTRLAARRRSHAEPRRLDRAQGRRASTTSRWSNSARRSTRNRRRSCCCRRPAARDPFYAEFGWTPATAPAPSCPTPTRCGRRQAPARSPPAIRSRSPTTTARAWTSAAPSRSTTNTCSPSRTRSPTKAPAPVTLFPYALISRHGTPHTLGYYILHEGLIGVLGNDGLQESPTRRVEGRARSRSRSTSPMAGSASPTNTGRRRWCPTPRRTSRRSSRPASLGSDADLPDRLTCSTRRRSRPAPPPRPARGCSPAPRKSRVDQRLSRQQLNLNRFDLLIDWGWFYFITKPMFFLIDWLLPPGRQFRPRHPAGHGAGQGRRSSRSPTNPTPRWRR